MKIFGGLLNSPLANADSHPIVFGQQAHLGYGLK